jgi:2',3'-cyclic-nucleotide 2'-phosphodiesterase/3'-nucleotidase
VIAGHTHLHLPGTSHQGLPGVDAEAGLVNGVPTVMAGALGSHLGIVDLTLELRDDSRWSVVSSSCHLAQVAGGKRGVVPEDQRLQRELEPCHAKTVRVLGETVGQSERHLHSYFSFFGTDDGLRVVAAAQAAAVRPLLDDLPEARGLPVVSVAAPSKFGGRAGPYSYTDVPAGEITKRHVADLNTFHNDVAAVVLSGGALLDWCNAAARRFRTIRPGGDAQPLLNPDFAGHDFDVFFGLRYIIDVSRDGGCPAGRRINGAILGDVPLAPDQDVVVVLNTYRAGGGGSFEALHAARRLPLPRQSLRDAITRYLAGDLGVDPIETAPWPWRFAPLPGAVAEVQSGPGARRHLHELGVSLVNVAGPNRDGFLNLTLAL